MENIINPPKITFKLASKVESNLIKKKINTLEDLIELALNKDIQKLYKINADKLKRLLPTLIKLQNLVGLTKIKNELVGHIMYFLLGFQTKNEDMMHIVITGPPGCGKTSIGHIIGEIYFYLDIIQKPLNKPIQTSECCIICSTFIQQNIQPPVLIPPFKRQRLNTDKSYKTDKSDRAEKYKLKFKVATRSDLIAKYLGQTAIKTQEVINSILGGVLFIDECYSLGNAEGRDSFSKECIDTINQNLTEKKNEFLCIIAGYKDALESSFFNYNEGLKRRFPFHYDIEKYSADELRQIYELMLSQNLNEWTITAKKENITTFFTDNYDCFPNSAGDIETLVFQTKIEHSKRAIILDKSEHKQINLEDINNGFKVYKLNRNYVKEDRTSYNMMYL